MNDGANFCYRQIFLVLRKKLLMPQRRRARSSGRRWRLQPKRKLKQRRRRDLSEILNKMHGLGL